jgi:membrane fusion protein (multidrug efflux system)
MRAEAQVDAAKIQSNRFAKLIETNAISRQEYDDALARVKTSEADVAAARASVKAARINLDFTSVDAPIAGRIGRTEVTEGAYVQQAQATLLATIQQLDPVYVDVTWSSAEMMRLRRALDTGELETVDGKAQVRIVLEDGREYDQPGALQFADVSVDQSTGSVTLRAIVPNPKGMLLPGMFVRARLEEGSMPTALLVPQRAVTRDQNARPVALVVGKDGKVERRLLETERAHEDAWVVTSGLVPGEQVIVEGLQKARPGATVKAVPARPPGTAQASPTPGGGPAMPAAGSAAPSAPTMPPASGSAAPAPAPAAVAPGAAGSATGSASPFAPASAMPRRAGG